MTPEEAHWTLKTTLKYGGSFYRALASAGLLADKNNLQRLFQAFPELKINYGPDSRFYQAGY